jgi:hypothetical protein
VEKIMSENLKGANTLPFAGFVTTDLKWVGGFSGYKDAGAFVSLLDEVEKSPLLQAKPEVAKKLDGLVAQATKAAEKGDWKAVMAASKSSAELKGRSPAREKLAGLVGKAREWAEGEMVKALESVKTGGERGAIRTQLKKVSAALAGENEAKDADQGLKALDKLTTIESMAAEQQDAAREKGAKDFAGSRWAAVFDKSVPKPAEPPK